MERAEKPSEAKAAQAASTPAVAGSQAAPAAGPHDAENAGDQGSKPEEPVIHRGPQRSGAQIPEDQDTVIPGGDTTGVSEDEATPLAFEVEAMPFSQGQGTQNPEDEDTRSPADKQSPVPEDNGTPNPVGQDTSTDGGSEAQAGGSGPDGKAPEAREMRKSQNEPSHELENQFILRLPTEHVSTVRKIIHSGRNDAKDKLKINLYPDKHQAIVQVEDVTLAAKLVDLPCVVGSFKTFDRKTFYKTADISQMLVCSATTSAAAAAAAPAVAAAPAAAAAAAEESRASLEKPTTSTDLKGIKIKDKNRRKKYIWKHGITPPLKNVRKKRFRKTQKNDDVSEIEEEVSFSEFIESPDVEKEVKRLLCSDAEALSARWEVITEDESKGIECQGIVPKFEFCSEVVGQTQGHLTPEHDTFRKMSTDFGSSNDELEHGRGNKDDDEDGDDDEEEEDEEEEEEDGDDAEQKLEAMFRALGQCKAKEGTASMVMEIQKQIHYVEKKLKKIQKKARKRGNLLKKVENMTLRNHLDSALKQLKLEENQKCEQLNELQKQLKGFLEK